MNNTHFNYGKDMYALQIVRIWLDATTSLLCVWKRINGFRWQNAWNVSSLSSVVL